MLEFSWTDECFLSVIIIGIVIMINSMRKQHIREAYHDILQKPIAVSAIILLLFFLLIAILDSIPWSHSQNNALTSHSNSLLDNFLAPLGNTYEKTYSAPMALTLFTTDTEVIQGKTEQLYPRLHYPPSRFKTPHHVKHHVLLTFSIAIGYGMASIGCFLFIIFIIAKKTGYKGYQSLQYSSIISALLTFFCCITLIIFTYRLSRDFHILGTGKIGQDIFYYTVKSIRTGLVIGILTTLFMMPLAIVLGVSAGYFGGLIDDIVQYTYTTLSSIPGVLLITASVLSMQTYVANHPDQFTTLAQNADARLLALCLILGVTSWTSLCRLLRAETLKLREIDFVLAAKTLGSNAISIMLKHILPNVMHIVIITLALDFSFLVLAEAVLSYVGVGVSPMTISWGNMINAARLELARDPVVWWPVLSAFGFMFVLVLASNLFADAIRDAFDPRSH